MGISIAEDNEFTILIADFIEALASVEEFKLNVWITGSELPFTFDNACSFYFMQEGFRVDTGNQIVWIFYDMINSLRLDYEN